MGTLFVVATPIGNLGDLSSRAAEVLRSVPLVVAEDTRRAQRLLAHVDAKPRLISYHRHSPESRRAQIVAALQHADAALISDSGTPGVVDPGAELVADAAHAGIAVSPIPGPSAIAAALSVSGFRGDRFTSFGYLSASGSKRRRTIAAVAECRETAVVLEAPHRLTTTLQEMAATMPERRLTLCRELTKLHEEVWRGTVAEAAAHFTEPRGEFVLVLEPQPDDDKPRTAVDDEAIWQLADELDPERASHSTRDLAAAIAARLSIPRREAYHALLRRD